jgi:hypothetical protein
VLICLILIITLCNIKTIVNFSVIRELKRSDYLYQTFTEHVISEEAPSDLSVSTIKYKDIEFQHAFGKPLLEKEMTGESFVIEFNEQKRIVIIGRKEDKPLHNHLSDEAKRLITDCYGQDMIKSDFKLLKRAYEATPDDISWFSLSKKKFTANMGLLLIKSYELPNNYGHLLKFETKSIQGFQYGPPGHKAGVILRIFNASGKADNSYDIVLQGYFTQAEIDIILSTLCFYDIAIANYTVI